MQIPNRCVFAMLLAAATSTAQIRLPALPLPGPSLQTLPQTLGRVDSRPLERLSDLRRLEISRLIRANRRVVETDPNGEPVVRNEIIMLSPTAPAKDRARAMGYIVDREEDIPAMNIRVTVLKVPADISLGKALRALRKADPGGTYDYNHIYLGSSASLTHMAAAQSQARAPPSAAAPQTVGEPQTAAAPPSARTGRPQSPVRIGLLDTGVDLTHPVFQNAVVHTWGCANHALPASHGTAVASLLIGRSDVFHGVQPGATLYSADVYCGSPTGGAVDALVAAFGWMVQEKVPVINISLVGPKNLLLEQAIGALTGNGYIVVAAVGNDGPAAPPLYPASYPHVVGVTAVDAQHRALPEAARGAQVMFASPGADLAAAAVDHAYAAVRGTSFAAPIVAALLANHIAVPNVVDAADAIDALSRTAIDLGPPGRDLTYGFGLVGAKYRIDPAPLIRR